MRHASQSIVALCGTCTLLSAAAAADQPAPGAADALQEIVVTAQRREERLQDVPISISVLSGADLDRSRAQGLTETLNRVPGVAAPITALGAPQVVIRGVTASSLLLTGASTAAYYLDSVPYGFVRSAIVPDANVYDLERIEVLRGPQGTLFGANAQSGVVRVLTHDPDLRSTEIKGRASSSNTADGKWNYRGDVSLNVPVVQDKLAVRVVGGYQDWSGWIDKVGTPGRNDANDAQISNLRLKVKAQPLENFSLVATSWLSRYDAGAQSIGDDAGNNSASPNEPVETSTDVHSLRLDFDASAFSVTSATSYLEYSIASDLDLSVFGFPVIQSARFESDVFAQELTFNSRQEGPWRWSFGAIYRDAEDRFVRTIGVPLSDYTDTSKSWATFGEITRALLGGKLEFTAGLRYFEDEVVTKERISSSGNPAAPLVDESAKFQALTPRAVLAWHSSEQLTFYASYAEGFRSGLTQNPEVTFAQPNFPALDADRLHNYEVGAKGSLAGGRMTIDAAVFFLDWKGVQQNLNVLFNGVNLNALVNGQSASGLGAELGLAIAPIDGLTLGLNGSWNDLAFDSDVVSGGNAVFRKGERLENSPEYTAGAFVDYLFPVGRFEVQLSASGNYTSPHLGRCFFGAQRIDCDGDAILVTRTSVALSAPENWTATLFVDNANDERDATVRPFGIADWGGRQTRPRTIGVQLDFQF